jgi:hypothetical protein
MAAAVAEMYVALCKAGIPAHAVAVMLGTMLAASAAAQQEGGDGS